MRLWSAALVLALAAAPPQQPDPAAARPLFDFTAVRWPDGGHATLAWGAFTAGPA